MAKTDACQGVARMGMRPSARFLAVLAALFVASAAGTIGWGASMATTGEMPMPGDWTMSMAWMRMPGQTWLGAGASFLGMWSLMMVAMMLPSLGPMLWRYRQAVGELRPVVLLSALVGAGYFFVWTALGAVLFPLGVAVAAAAMRWSALARAFPMVAGLVVLAAGALQGTAWKARHLACCRALSVPTRATAATAWRYGLGLGRHCGLCCAGLTAVLLVLGQMDLGVMAAVTVAVTAERLAPAGVRVARAIGAVLVAGGLFLMVRAG